MSRQPTDKPRKSPVKSAAPVPAKPAGTGDRIAKVLARAGIASRRDAEKIIAEGRVTVNGRVIDSPALDVTSKDRITVDGKPLAAAEPPRLWLYHKPAGLVTTARDELGRPTVFEHLPEDLPRVMTVGRLDLNSEGLLLLTNDGELKRRLELPSTGWLRRYRVRLNGRPEDAEFNALREGITIDGERFQPMIVSLDRQQGANAWLTVGIREGRNREVRRAMEAVGYTVNRLIRISYGPFQIGELAVGDVEEVRPRVLRDQLGLDATPGQEPGDKAPGTRPRVTTRSSSRNSGSGPRDEAPAYSGKAAPRRSDGDSPRPVGPGGARKLAASAARWSEEHSTPAARPGLGRGGARADRSTETAPTRSQDKAGAAPRGTAAADDTRPARSRATADTPRGERPAGSTGTSRSRPASETSRSDRPSGSAGPGRTRAGSDTPRGERPTGSGKPARPRPASDGPRGDRPAGPRGAGPRPGGRPRKG